MQLTRRFQAITFHKTAVIEQLVHNRALSLAILNFLIIAVVSIFYPKTFFSFSNFTGILLSLSLEAILAAGMMFLIVSGEFDLSIGATYALGGAVVATVLKQLEWVPMPVAILIGLLVCIAIGFANGILVARVGVNALIATLAMMMIVRGVAIFLAGQAIVDLPKGFPALGQTVIFGIRMPIYYMAITVILCSILLEKFRFFRQFYFIGGNKKSAELSGINVRRTTIINFAIMGGLAGLGGIIYAARMNNAIGTAGAGLNLRIIAAVVVGGGSLSGGKGNVPGAFMGILFLGLLQNVMIIAGVSVYFQSIVTGVILAGAVLLDVILQKKYSNFEDILLEE